MEKFKAQITRVEDLTHKEDISGRELKRAGFQMRSWGPFPPLESLIGKKVEIHVLDDD